MAYAGGIGKCISLEHLVQTNTLVGLARSTRARSTKVDEMYSVNRIIHERHGSVVQIERTENGSLLTPYQAVNRAIHERRLWMESGIKKVRILVDEQVLTPKQAEFWANEEYKSLPKCEGCAKILNGDVVCHQLSGSKLFCSTVCADKDYLEEVEKRKDEEEIDYL
jgi:hypothetical protein